jgi:hypothetical protein
MAHVAGYTAIGLFALAGLIAVCSIVNVAIQFYKQ